MKQTVFSPIKKMALSRMHDVMALFDENCICSVYRTLDFSKLVSLTLKSNLVSALSFSDNGKVLAIGTSCF